MIYVSDKLCAGTLDGILVDSDGVGYSGGTYTNVKEALDGLLSGAGITVVELSAATSGANTFATAYNIQQELLKDERITARSINYLQEEINSLSGDSIVLVHLSGATDFDDGAASAYEVKQELDKLSGATHFVAISGATSENDGHCSAYDAKKTFDEYESVVTESLCDIDYRIKKLIVLINDVASSGQPVVNIDSATSDNDGVALATDIKKHLQELSNVLDSFSAHVESALTFVDISGATKEHDGVVSAYDVRTELEKDELVISNSIIQVDEKVDAVSAVCDTKSDKILYDNSVNGDSITVTIKPNRFYDFGEVGELTVDLDEVVDTTIYNEYMFQFKCGASATVLSLPSDITWYLDNNTVLPNKTYQISIVNKLAVLAEF